MSGLRRPTLAEQIIIDEIVRHPHKLPRILANQTRANACAGGCGRPVWGANFVPQVRAQAEESKMNLLTEAQAERRHTLWKLGIWTTKDFQEIPVQKMSDEHLLNVYNVLLKAAERKLAKTVAFYASCSYPNGEMAQEAFEREYDYWLDADPQDILNRHPFIPALRQEWHRRHPEEIR